MNKLLLIFNGPPCSGKGSQSNFIAIRYNFLLIELGSIIRNEIEKRSYFGLFLYNAIKFGLLIPDKVIYFILDYIFFIYKKNSSLKGYIIDGFPRNTFQYKILSLLKKKYLSCIRIYFFIFYMSKNLLISRMYSRLFCFNCKKSINIVLHNLSSLFYCSICNYNLFNKRHDDNIFSILNRITFYNKEYYYLSYYLYKTKYNFLFLNSYYTIYKNHYIINDVIDHFIT